jgi:hypothetical protein
MTAPLFRASKTIMKVAMAKVSVAGDPAVRLMARQAFSRLRELLKRTARPKKLGFSVLSCFNGWQCAPLTKKLRLHLAGLQGPTPVSCKRLKNILDAS